MAALLGRQEAPCKSSACIIDFEQQWRETRFDRALKDFMDSVDNRKALEGEQLKRLRLMLQAVLPPNEFYRKKFSALGACEINSMQTLKSLPFTTKNELVEDQMGHPPFGSDLTFPRARYIRIHQTS